MSERKGPEESSAGEWCTGGHRGAPGKRAAEQGGPRREMRFPGRTAGHLFNTTVPSRGTTAASRCSHRPQAGPVTSTRKGCGKPEKALPWPPAAGCAPAGGIRDDR